MRPQHAPTFRFYSDRDGLPLDGISTLLQSRNGFLWIGTFGGLARFDGRKFTHFPVHAQLPNLREASTQIAGPSSMRILSLIEDPKGRIWIGTDDSGINLYDKGRFFQLNTCNAHCQIIQLTLLDDSVLAATDIGLFKINLDSLETVSIFGDDPVSITSAVSLDGRIYVVANGAFSIVENGEPWVVKLPDNIPAPTYLYATKDTLYSTSKDGIAYYRPDTQTWTAHTIGATLKIAESSDGSLLTSTYDGRIYQIKPNKPLIQIADAKTPRSTLAIKDFDKNIWIATLTRGLIRARTSWIGALNDPAFEMDTPARAVAPDGKGGLYLSNGCNGTRHWKADGSLHPLQIDLSSHEVCVETLHFSQRGDLWLGNATGQVFLLRQGRSQAELILRWRDTLPVRTIYSLSPTQLFISVGRNTYLVNTDDQGNVLDYSPTPALNGLIVRKITEARRGGHWFVGDHGAYRMRGDVIVERWGTEHGLSQRFARTLIEQEDGTIWIGTYGGGLNRIVNGKITSYRQTNGLYDDTVSCLFEDERGHLWLAGNRGISVIDPASATDTQIRAKGFGSSDGLASSEVNGGNQSACWSDERKRLIISMIEGFAVIDPSRYQAEENEPPPALIDHIAVGGEEIIPSSELRLNVAARNIEIGFTAVQLSYPERLQFRFRLNGVDPDWIDGTATRSVVYPSLPWGNYSFQVQARLIGEDWPEAWTEVRIMHPAPWYQSSWLWLICSLLALMLLLDVTWTRQPSSTENPLKPDPDKAKPEGV